MKQFKKIYQKDKLTKIYTIKQTKLRQAPNCKNLINNKIKRVY